MAELNGRPVTLAELQALALTNYGHFTSMRVENGRTRGLPLHLARLARDCQALFGVDLDLDRVRTFARQALPPVGESVLRVTVFDPALDLNHIGGDAQPQILVTSRPAGPMPLPPLRVRSVVHTRDLAAVKSVGLVGQLRHRREAQRTGFDDALFTDSDAVVSEGGTWNVGFVRDDQVIWPDADCLCGTTMELLRQVRPSTTTTVRLPDLAAFDAAFATNVGIGVRSISAVDGLPFPDTHPVVEELRKLYTELPDDLI
ncbi:aminotransferase class IV family protein [Kitasatospora sp. NPDC049258]|uniref:aminotransferase class IV family protein n=1 Tax=Kitasatospora sp. NPDC049258 TaxID=3155394 RepID=UPI0034446597